MPCGQDPCLERGRNPRQRERIMTVLPTLFASQQQGICPCTNNWCVPCARPSWRATCPAQPPARQPSPGPGSGISRSTVELAYGRLEAEGYLVRKVGAGSFVALAAVRPAPRPPQSAAGLSRRGQEMALGGACHDVPEVGTTFASSQPDPPVSSPGTLGSADAATVAPARQRLDELRGSPGLGELRAAISSYLVQSRGVVCEPDQILILTSSQQGILLATQLLIDAGDTVWVEDPGYPGARTAMESAGARVHPVPVDEEGSTLMGIILPAPHLLHPGTPVSPWRPHEPARRMALLAEAERHGAWILEDDYDGEYQYDQRPLPALQGLDGQGRVIYVGTFSKGAVRLAAPRLPGAAQAADGLLLPRPGRRRQPQQPVAASGHGRLHPGRALRHPPAPEPPLYQSRRDLLLAELAEHCPGSPPSTAAPACSAPCCCPRWRGALDRCRQRLRAGAAPSGPVLPGPADAGRVAARLWLPRQPDAAPTLSSPGSLDEIRMTPSQEVRSARA